MSLYNRNPLEPFTRANSDDVNNETAKIEAAINQLEALITGIVGGTGSPALHLARLRRQRGRHGQLRP
jgi:hypothetical protein